MPRPCAECGRILPKAAYSTTQWKKKSPDGGGSSGESSISRCKECVAGVAVAPAVQQRPVSASASAGTSSNGGSAANNTPTKSKPQSTGGGGGSAKGSKKKQKQQKQTQLGEKAAVGRDNMSVAVTVKASNVTTPSPTTSSSTVTTPDAKLESAARSAETARTPHQDHSEVHVTPSGTMAVCADGDDSASRSGSEDEGVGGNNVVDNYNNRNGSDYNEHVLFEPGYEDNGVGFAANGGGSGGTGMGMTASESMMAAAVQQVDAAGGGSDGSPADTSAAMLEDSPTGKAMEAWSEAMESKTSSRVDLPSAATAAAEAGGTDIMASMATATPPAPAKTVVNNSVFDDDSNAGAAASLDISAELTPRIRPARVADLSTDGGAALGATAAAGGAPPLPLIDLGETASGPTIASAVSAGTAGGVPDAVHLPAIPTRTSIERRISDVSVPTSGAPPPPTTAAGATSTGTISLPSQQQPVGALSREVTEETVNTSGSNHAPPVPPPPAPRVVIPAGSATATVPVSAAATVPNAPVATARSKRAQHKRLPSLPATVRDAHFAHRISTGDRIRLGICAMDKKARSKPMGEILSRLDETLFEVIFFGDDLIKNSPVEDWPEVDVLIAFYSSGYPLAKAEEYVKLRRPFVLNDLKMQWTLMDRRKVYDLLESSGIDVPRHVYVSRDGYVSTGTGDGNSEGGDLIEHDDHIEVNGVAIHKPFVEKPVDADDHDIAIYYPTSAGGGCKKLFRKVGDRSSEFYPMINDIRRDGSYIYEEFVETQGTDVKMYTVGPDYGHAEARKSPTVDGKVERNSDGKEVRFPVILSLREKEIARRIVIVFKQQVCGFDLLRVQQNDSLVSYVCDVNGWSFVKNSRKYYDDCAQVLTEHMLAAVNPARLSCFSALDPLLTTMPDNQSTPKKERRKTVSAMQRVSRMLQGVPEPDEDEDAPGDDASLSRSDADAASTQAPTTLEEGAVPVSQIPHQLAVEPPSIVTSAASSVVDDRDEEVVSVKEPSTHKEELRCVIAVVRHGDRTPKQKLKVVMSDPRVLAYFHDHTKKPKKELKVKAKKPLEEFLKTIILMIAEKEAEAMAYGRKRKSSSDSGQLLYKLRHMRDVLQRWKIGGLNRKLQIKPQKWEETVGENGEEIVKCSEVQLILKWGGNLTKLGERQAINLGQRIRHELYPDAPGGGILRLHSTFRHDLKIKTSDEGRVMKTAAAGAKGLLELEGEIPPILVSLVHKEKDSIHMLDPSGNKAVKTELEICKKKINENLQKDVDFDKTSVEEHEQILGPVELTSLHTALQKLQNPRKALFQIRAMMRDLLEQLDEMLDLMTSCDESNHEGGDGKEGESALSAVHIKLYKGETLLELTERWRLLYRKFYDEDTDTFDLSRVPDVHDNVRFDMLHNPHLGLTETLEKLYNMAKAMADCVVPQEYGTTILEKRSIGQKMCRLLIDKIKYDLIIARTDDQVDMRYMINMEYSADLPINTMGRRVRTRLYFTSESHLHTILNVLRFTYDDPRSSSFILSSYGRALVDKTPELCYLTQIVFRLFEDPKKDMSDPKRFRIEILFSPGATATPLHMAEMDRDLDNSRFETDPLKLISKEGLSCQEIEDYFTDCIDQGRTDEDDESVLCPPTSTENKKKSQEYKDERQQRELAQNGQTQPAEANSSGKKVADENASTAPPKADVPAVVSRNVASPGNGEDGESKSRGLADTAKEKVEDVSDDVPASGDVDDDATDTTPVTTSRSRRGTPSGDSDVNGADGEEVVVENQIEEEERIERMARILEKKYFWASVSILSALLGIGCLVLAQSARGPRRYNTRR